MRRATVGAYRYGPPVFCLVHGLGVGQAYFEPLARLLEGAVIRPELREPQPIAELGRRLGASLPGPAVLVANSMGCQVAAALAADRPDLVEALVLVGPTVDPEARSAVRHLLRLAVDGWYEPPRLTATVVRDYFVHGPSELMRQARYALEDRIEERLPRIEAATLVVRGEHDPLSSARWCGEVTALLPNARLVTIAGGGHAVHYSQPRELVDELSRFLAETRAAPG
ncbi:MAG: alpha/beta fold hydrolase, partial [Actinobacteria bacterium]|nr:alpha/beta fold hydrolase [Actinomycetota bacterium]